MKKYFLTLLFLFTCLFNQTFAASYGNYNISLTPGTYQMIGSNPNSNIINYRGKVIIKPCGSNYSLIWIIGSNQVQTGVGILKDNILSVAFYDPAKNLTGVVSFVVKENGQLDGTWASYNSSSFGRELLTYENSNF